MGQTLELYRQSLQNGEISGSNEEGNKLDDEIKNINVALQSLANQQQKLKKNRL